MTKEIDTARFDALIYAQLGASLTQRKSQWNNLLISERSCSSQLEFSRKRRDEKRQQGEEGINTARLQLAGGHR
jgi:hypothetical protein